ERHRDAGRCPSTAPSFARERDLKSHRGCAEVANTLRGRVDLMRLAPERAGARDGGLPFVNAPHLERVIGERPPGAELRLEELFAGCADRGGEARGFECARRAELRGSGA